MKYEKDCRAVVYRFRYDRLEFLAGYLGQGRYSFPAVRVLEKEKKDDPDRVEVRGRYILEVALDTVFRDDLNGPSEGKPSKYTFAAEAMQNGGVLDDQDPEEIRLEWCPFERLDGRMPDESDRELLKHATAYLSVKKCVKNPVKDPGYIWYREHAVDIHSHVLPGVDDGSQSIGESMELLGLSWEEGFRVVFATPHYGIENGYAPRCEQIRKSYRSLSEYMYLSSCPSQIMVGAEWYCSEDIVERIRNNESFAMGDSEFYMVEFLEWGDLTEPAEVMLRRLKKMRDSGINTILAHPERYKAIQENWDLAKRICDLGVKLQVNAYDLALNPKDATRNLAQWMAKEELISFIGSDMHGTGLKPDGKPKRKPQMKEGIRWLYENVDQEYANEIVRLNAERYLGVEKLL